MTLEQKPGCRLCIGRICTPLIWGRLINDTGKEKPSDMSQLKATTTSIKDCPTRELIEIRDSEDSNLELGS